MKRIVAAFLSILMLGGMSFAADAPVTDWTEVIVVDAEAPGPAMWHLKKGDSEIWFLGTVGLMPENLAWNTMRLERAIDGANVVLLEPRASADFLDILGMSWFLLTHRGALSMPDDRKLEDSLSPELRARFVKAREALKKNADEYEDDSPLLAGFKLLAAYVETDKLTPDLPQKAAQKIAHAKHVKVRRIAEYSAVPLIEEMLKLPPTAGRVCLENALSDYETLSQHAALAADAWAVGDIDGIKAHYSTSQFQACIAQAKKYNELDQRAVDDTLKAIREALSKPGKTVMLIDIGWLFRAGGVAEKLAAEGLTIEGATK